LRSLALIASCAYVCGGYRRICGRGWRSLSLAAALARAREIGEAHEVNRLSAVEVEIAAAAEKLVALMGGWFAEGVLGERFSRDTEALCCYRTGSGYWSATTCCTFRNGWSRKSRFPFCCGSPGGC